MPNSQDSEHKSKIGLALSGGGFRATLYHCGALIRLNEVGLLSKVNRVTSVSGGSIASAKLALSWNKLNFDTNGSADNLNELVIEPLREFCRKNIDVNSGLLGLIPFGKTMAEKLAEKYDELLYSGETLAELPETPDFIFKATNLKTGRMVQLSRVRVSDYLVGEVKDVSSTKIAQAVAASSGFPPVFSPVILQFDEDSWTNLEGTVYFNNAEHKKELELSDGGVYDNLGLERIDHFGTILVSDAGAPFKLESGFNPLSPKQVMRALEVAMDQARALRLRQLIEDATLGNCKVGYWGIGQTTDNLLNDYNFNIQDRTLKDLAGMRTRLNHFNNKEQAQLINWGYVSCDSAIRQRILETLSAPTQLPEPAYHL